MEPLIVCENLVKIYPLAGVEIVALQGLDLTVERGEMLGIVGASGSGKSTLLNVLGGLDRPSAGKVLVDGKDLFKLTEEELDRYRRQEVGFVWQQTSRNLIPYLSAQENVELPMRLAGVAPAERRRRAQEFLETLGLQGRLGHYPVQMSGGEQQRTAIGVALANRPLVLLADEPTGEVDSATAGEVFTALRSANERYGMTTLIVSHDLNIGRFTHRVVAIRDGKTSTETFHGRREAQPASAEAISGPARSVEMPQTEPAQNTAPLLAHPESVELAVLDGAGRVQIPHEYLEALNIGDRVRLELLDRIIAVHPVAGRGRAAHNRETEQADFVELYTDEDQAPEVRRQGWLARLKSITRKREKSSA